MQTFTPIGEVSTRTPHLPLAGQQLGAQVQRAREAIGTLAAQAAGQRGSTASAQVKAVDAIFASFAGDETIFQ